MAHFIAQCFKNRRHLVNAILACALIVWAGVLAGNASAATIYSGALDGSSTTMTDRITRNAVASTCASAKAFPNTQAGPNIQYQTISYIHTGPARCVTFTYSAGSCAANGFLSIYNGAFDPANKATNYLADIGNSVVGATAGVNLTTGQTLTLVVNGVAAGQNCTFSIESDDPSVVFVAPIDATAPTMTGRIFRDATPSTCAAIDSFPGDANPAAPNIQYRTAAFTNAGPTRCVTFTVAGGTCDVPSINNYTFLSVYSGPFNPANRSVNYLADIGTSGIGQKAAVVLSAGQTVTLVVNGANAGMNCSVLIAADPPGTSPTVPHDFNGDLKSDILWRNTDGNNALWVMNGSSVSSVALLGGVDTSWQPVGQRDFDGDGKTDILWRNSGGTNAIWFMSGSTVTSVALIGGVGPTWSVAGTADFNGDGKGDILWREAGGTTAIWFMNGATVTSVALLGNVDPSWAIVGTGDFNGDGRGDILWRNSGGNNAIWLMNGATALSASVIGVIPTNWSVAGTADFNSDGKSDILWRNTDGSNAIWFMDGISAASVTLIGGVGTTWNAASVGDYNGDGRGDILWREAGGSNAIWFMNGSTVTSVSLIGGVANNWNVQNAGAN